MAERSHPADGSHELLADEQVAEVLEQVAELLERRPGANPFRVRGYRRAARTVRESETPVTQLWRRKGLKGLRKLHGFGPGIAGAVHELLCTGRLRLLEVLEREEPPTTLLDRMPGVGPVLAGRIQRRLGVMTPAELETCDRSGRLQQIRGLGPHRLAAIREAIAAVHSRSAHRRWEPPPRRKPTRGGPKGAPSVDLLLELDAEYRRRANERTLPTVPPRHGGDDWLPVLRTRREGFRFTAVFADGGIAHKLGRNHDWVTISHQRDEREGQHTVVTVRTGPMRGQRVVRGREEECRTTTSCEL